MRRILVSLMIMFAVVACTKDPVRMIEDSKLGIVVIMAKKESVTPAEAKGGLGTGSIIGENVILTNFHVAGDSTELKIGFITGDDLYDAEFVYGDKESDVAVIRLKDWGKFARENPEHRALTLATHRPREGETIYTIGHPWGLFYSVSKGIVSTAKRKSPMSVPTWWIQTDAHVYNGNSGGPMLNENGEIVGMNSVMVANEGGSYGFAIPTPLVEKITRDLEKYKEVRWAMLGVLMKSPGVTVKEITPGSAASRSELRVNDKIVGLVVGNRVIKVADSLDVISELSLIDYDTPIYLMVEREYAVIKIQVIPSYKLSKDFPKE